MISRTFKLCLNAGSGSAPYINVNQYDEGETWLFELYSENGERYIPSSGAIVGVKSDGHGIVNTGTVDSEGRVVITETQQMTASAGRAIYELSIDGLTHGTANFIVAVERKPTDDAVMSDSDLSLIQEAVDAAATIEDLIEGHDPDEVIADAVDAWLDAHPEATTTVQDGAITSAKLNDSVKTGVFEDMTVGTSLAVMNDEGQTDNLAYKFRQTGADAVRELDEIHGGTIAWNQLVEHGDFDSASGWVGTWTVANGEAVFTPTGSGAYSLPISRPMVTPANHTILIHARFKCTSANRIRARYPFVGTEKTTTANTWEDFYWMSKVTSGGTAVGTQSDSIAGAETRYKYMECFDLTAMFGSTVADAIYAMEQASAGSGVAYFRSLFPNAYYAYNSGELVSVEGLSAHETVGFNQWDEEYESGAVNGTSGNTYNDSSKIRSKNYIPVLPSRDYYIKAPAIVNIAWYDSNKVFITGTNSASANYARTSPSNAMYFKFSCNVSTYNNDICINISDPSKNGTYKPYQKHTYPLDSTLTLRGVPKWSNGLYFDGDIYRHDGSVSRRYGIVDLGTLNWVIGATSESGVYRMQTTDIASLIKRVSSTSENGNLICGLYTTKTLDAVFTKSKGIAVSASGTLAVFDENYSSSNSPSAFKTAMSGVYLVYELATPTAETADPYQQYQICDGKGTEEYISTTVTPVGHSTFYPVDIVAKVNKLPSDFSTLIAPTEEGFKATRNYTAKQFLIVNNQLYRVTANIANGANIVPNTNVTAVTIADILTTLI